MSQAPAPASLDVSAIVIARNEEANIADCLAAVFRALERAVERGAFRTYEVMLVDSASTDRTVELASSFPASIVRLKRDWRLSAAAGKATGARLTRGSVLFFVDGDYVPDLDWVAETWTLLQERRVGAVCGWDDEQVAGTSILARALRNQDREGVPELAEIDSIAYGLVKREAYEDVGGLHPYLRGAEDRDFGARLRAAGWRILRTRRTMGAHRWAEPGSELTYVTYFRSVAIWSLGDGQACRARWHSPPLRRAFLARYATLRYALEDMKCGALAFLLLLGLLGAFLGGVIALVAVTAVVAFFASLIAWGRRRSRSWRETVFDFQGAFYGPFRQAFFGLGLLRRLPAPETYPVDVEVVKTARARGPA